MTDDDAGGGKKLSFLDDVICKANSPSDSNFK